MLFRGVCYATKTIKKSWFDAEETCAAEGAHLPSCISRTEFIFLSSLTESSTDYWIGIDEMYCLTKK